MPAKLSQHQRLQLIEKVVINGQRIKDVCKNAGISRTIFYRWLKRYRQKESLQPKIAGRKLQKIKKPSGIYVELSPQKRLEMIEMVTKYRKPVADVCREYQISRPVFYKWLKRYHQKQPLLINKKPQPAHYYQQTPDKYEQMVLSLVSQYPELGVEKIVAALPRIGLGH